jgi:hypothetical protein
MSVARHGPSKAQLPRLIAGVASASAPAGPERATLGVRSSRRRRRQGPLRFRDCTRLAVTTGEWFRPPEHRRTAPSCHTDREVGELGMGEAIVSGVARRRLLMGDAASAGGAGDPRA